MTVNREGWGTGHHAKLPETMAGAVGESGTTRRELSRRIGNDRVPELRGVSAAARGRSSGRFGWPGRGRWIRAHPGVPARARPLRAVSLPVRPSMCPGTTENGVAGHAYMQLQRAAKNTGEEI